MRNRLAWIRRIAEIWENQGSYTELVDNVKNHTGFSFTNEGLEPLLNTLARVFAQRGDARTVAVLSDSVASIAQTGYDNWNGGTSQYTLTIQVPFGVYAVVEAHVSIIESAILETARPLTRQHDNDYIQSVIIIPELVAKQGWRDKAKDWVAGKGVTNQGRVRSDNIAARSHDGLLFRSQAEIFLYGALKRSGVSFAPLPVFLRGGEVYRRIEPDFVLLKDGVLMIVEVDGDTVHLETPAEAHDRTTFLVHEGAHVERVVASDCDSADKARACAEKLLAVFAKLKSSK